LNEWKENSLKEKGRKRESKVQGNKSCEKMSELEKTAYILCLPCPLLYRKRFPSFTFGILHCVNIAHQMLTSFYVSQSRERKHKGPFQKQNIYWGFVPQTNELVDVSVLLVSWHPL
jgi:hypothetical protein